MQGDREIPQELFNFLRSIETCTHCFDFMPEERLEQLPTDVRGHIIELEELIGRLSCEATAVLFHQGYLPFIAKRGVK